MWRRTSVLGPSVLGAAVLGAAVLALAACTAGGATGGTTITAPPTMSATQAATASAGSGTTVTAPTTGSAGEATAQGAPVTVDPCTVYPPGEASTLSGLSLQAGTPQTYDQGAKGCFYAGGTDGITAVTIAQATSSADATAVWDQERTRAQQALQQNLPSGLQLDATLTDVSGLGDRASVASFTGGLGPVTVSGSAIYVLKGATFFGVSVVRLNGTAPSVDALKAEARTMLGRV